MPSIKLRVISLEFRVKNILHSALCTLHSSFRTHHSSLITHNSPGFTLIELLIAVSIVAILAGIGFITYSQTQLVGRDSKRKQDLKALQTGLELFYQQNKDYPNTGCALTAGGCLSTGSSPWIPGLDNNFINTVPKDPTDPGTDYRYNYIYDGSSKTYKLCARLENASDTMINTVCSAPYNYGVTSI